MLYIQNTSELIRNALSSHLNVEWNVGSSIGISCQIKKKAEIILEREIVFLP